jgi:hypothetical protein
MAAFRKSWRSQWFGHFQERMPGPNFYGRSPSKRAPRPGKERDSPWPLFLLSPTAWKSATCRINRDDAKMVSCGMGRAHC